MLEYKQKIGNNSEIFSHPISFDVIWIHCALGMFILVTRGIKYPGLNNIYI